MVINRQRIDPMPVITGAAEYPTDLEEKIAAYDCHAHFIDALTPALEAGSAKAVNIVLLGALSTVMEFPQELWQKALEISVPEKFLAMNKTAFALGRNLKLR